MSRSKNPENYPDQLGQALTAALGNPDGLKIHFGSHAEAMKMRSMFYAYINALDAHERDSGLDYDLALAPKCRRIQISVQAERLSLLDKQYNPAIMAIRRALNGGGFRSAGTDEQAREDAESALRHQAACREAGTEEVRAEPRTEASLPQPPAPGVDSAELIEQLFGAGVPKHDLKR